MTSKQNDIIKQLKELAENNADIAVLWLYGSRAKGTEHENSDYDLAIAFKDFSLSNEDAYLRPNLLKLDIATALQYPEDKISVVDVNRAPVYLAFNIIETGVVLYTDGSNRFYTECNRVWSQLNYLQKENRLE
ncbi:nucleotidyltransferase domain-containing protein [Shewanella sp. 202IG2-18]|uniref:type VII toxin-antitoxin system MntA family adenylyltransferase antitoxin n=1 Tax=Parashewanella hymeniacidonis TaxID=2807618 RepID=UPI001960687A|nr:nucleotidyltransferase domain-containing protein [Parashewanella hymeniacidonis]MBM7072091.1 nucleotidyltransferase domain-containing protein [Parashewanella hymeniacidonis]